MMSSMVSLKYISILKLLASFNVSKTTTDILIATLEEHIEHIDMYDSWITPFEADDDEYSIFDDDME